jgi:nucleoid DNA-binding protein
MELRRELSSATFLSRQAQPRHEIGGFCRESIKIDVAASPYTRGVKAMTKKDIVLKIADETGIKQIDVKKVVQKTFDHIVLSLIRGEKVELRNFGVFKLKERRSRTGRNPRTGQVVPVPARKVVVFKAGLEMKKKIK